ncbi:MAG: hypothetical protein IKL00_05175 [Oscillospiraceae bacterium]|nr:hypothetical protein [Oscillospiraceae bacterium]
MENQNKTVMKTMRLSRETAEKIEAAARIRGMNFSEYLLDCALHRECRLTPELLCKITNILQRCRDALENKKLKKWMINEVSELWECLK